MRSLLAAAGPPGAGLPWGFTFRHPDPAPSRGRGAAGGMISGLTGIAPKPKGWQEGTSLPKNHILRKLTLANAPFPAPRE